MPAQALRFTTTHPPLQPKNDMYKRSLSSTTARLTNAAKPNPGELPKFSLKQLGATPRTRAVIYLGLLTVAVVEGVGWVKYAPKVLGWEQKEESK